MTTTETSAAGTGADGGAPGQDTGSARVTRSADCPEAPAQARRATSRTVPSATAWTCPKCGAEAMGVEIRGVYDGVLFWACTCGHAWPRDWSGIPKRQAAAEKYAAAWTADHTTKEHAS